MNRTTSSLLTVALLMTAAPTRLAHAHFPWLATDDEGRAVLFFGESPNDRVYKLPESVAKSNVFSRAVDDKRTVLKLQPVDEQEFIGLRSGEPINSGAALEATCEYGLYHSMLLTYYAQYLPGGTEEWREVSASGALPLQVTPSIDGDLLRLTAAWNGKPRAGVSIMLIDSADQQHVGQTDDQGAVVLKGVAAGPAGVVANFIDETKGDFQGERYESIGHYATLTFDYRANLANTNAKAATDSDGSTTAFAAASATPAQLPRQYPPLPEAVSSFGGAVADGYLYVYSGHTGVEHDHSRDNLSKRFVRLKLNDGAEWEELPMQTPLQGVPLVAHAGRLYRLGGLSARNAQGEKEDLHSVAEFACFDPQTGQWTDLPALPEARSSHDAVVIGDKLCVVGGWTLAGPSKGQWLDSAWMFDLANPTGEWKSLPSPPFRRRALALGQWKGKLVAIGGMSDKRDISRSVDVLDIATGEWSQAAAVPGDGMDGFGISIWNFNERLFASGTQTEVFVLAADGSKWNAVAKMQRPRFFHRLLPGENGRLLAVGGASEEGHLATIEEIIPQLQRRPEQ